MTLMDILYGFRDEDFLFLGEKGRRIHIRAVDNRIRKLCKRAGIEPAKSAHDIRRTVATRLYRNTHDIELVRKFLGHSDVQTTWGYIVDIDAEEEDRIRVVAALEGMIRSGMTSASSGTTGNIIDFIQGKNKYGSRIPVPMENAGSKCKLTACHTQVTHFF